MRESDTILVMCGIASDLLKFRWMKVIDGKSETVFAIKRF